LKRGALEIRPRGATRPIEVLPSLTGPADPANLRSREDFAKAIAAEWAGAQKAFLRIGEMLDRAQHSLPEDEYAVLCASLPFGKVVRSQLLTAYRAIHSGLVPRHMEAAGYTTVHLLAIMSEEERAAAADAGLLRPDVKRQELRAIRAPRFGRPNQPAPPDHAALLAERERLLRRVAEIDALLNESDASAPR